MPERLGNLTTSEVGPAPKVSDPLLIVDNVSKAFTDGPTPVAALRSVHFHVDQGEFVTLLGPSGSGKSTILRIAGGLLPPDDGAVWFDGRQLVAPHDQIGFVFQKTNLMPWRTVLDNILLPLELHNRTVGEQKRSQARALLSQVGLDGFEDVYPKHLSGGMAQRAVLARTLIHEPRLLLMDEPFGALDALTRERMNEELLRIHDAQLQTVLMVTHSISEAAFLSDRVLILSQRPGRLVAQLPIDLPRPRTVEILGSRDFGILTQEIRAAIEESQ